jgi:transposase
LLPNDIAEGYAERAARIRAEANARRAKAKAHARTLEIEKLKFAIAKLRHQRLANRPNGAPLIEQLELQFADLEETAAEAETAAEIAAPANADKAPVRGFERTKPTLLLSAHHHQLCQPLSPRL